ncbi:uncharacterized protein LOC122359040 [Puntigrus tetrazona]|uniref:uncharacterized protein LOC122331788 n=1 Tax=Puntigrus tetrazona TaxID=1606681 RepID=UPI001C8AF9AF|nr:uncharacterized protein LOC122331788 [Puntigrus tetrazona]XP_043115091.1 uncharacterized protein LOC122359040 [Puntigrus tetrazona]
MMIPRTICFVYFALLFRMPHANHTEVTKTSLPANNQSLINKTTGCMIPSNNKGETSNPVKGHCFFCFPTGTNILLLIAAGLTVGCLAFLLTTLLCACQVCQLRQIISSLQPRYDNTDRHARREKSESPCWEDEGQVDRHPTETCFMLSEIVTAQEESREDQENKTEEEKESQQPSTVDLNGDMAQESPEPDAKAPENSDTGV